MAVHVAMVRWEPHGKRFLGLAPGCINFSKSEGQAVSSRGAQVAKALTREAVTFETLSARISHILQNVILEHRLCTCHG